MTEHRGCARCNNSGRILRPGTGRDLGDPCPVCGGTGERKPRAFLPGEEVLVRVRWIRPGAAHGHGLTTSLLPAVVLRQDGWDVDVMRVGGTKSQHVDADRLVAAPPALR